MAYFSHSVGTAHSAPPINRTGPVGLPRLQRDVGPSSGEQNTEAKKWALIRQHRGADPLKGRSLAFVYDTSVSRCAVETIRATQMPSGAAQAPPAAWTAGPKRQQLLFLGTPAPFPSDARVPIQCGRTSP